MKPNTALWILCVLVTIPTLFDMARTVYRRYKTRHAPPPTAEERFRAECVRKAVEVTMAITNNARDGVAEWTKLTGEAPSKALVILEGPRFEDGELSYVIKISAQENGAIQ